ncbi:hypothetical protein F5887DRAFT_1057729 [Amanita rubescens]|nr:hypothetical protein F5887DRAFT_1057729 [Amanita rubescens]
MTLNRLKALKTGIPHNLDHVLALENILKGAKKPRVTFSMVAAEDLKKAGVTRKLLIFEPAKAEAEIVDLHSRIKIYARVNMDVRMRITQGDGVQISHPVSYELWLSGNINYAVIEYEDVRDYKDRLLAPGGSREDAFPKRQSLEQSLVSCIPEAVSQAIALLRSAKDVVENSDLPLREIVQLVCEWLRPTKTDLFTLE